jgi:hypothetical protein
MAEIELDLRENGYPQYSVSHPRADQASGLRFSIPLPGKGSVGQPISLPGRQRSSAVIDAAKGRAAPRVRPADHRRHECRRCCRAQGPAAAQKAADEAEKEEDEARREGEGHADGDEAARKVAAKREKPPPLKRRSRSRRQTS